MVILPWVDNPPDFRRGIRCIDPPLGCGKVILEDMRGPDSKEPLAEMWCEECKRCFFGAPLQ